MATVKKGRLGKGVDKLIQPVVSPVSSAKKEENTEKPQVIIKQQETKIRLSDIEPNKKQPRKYFDEAALNELAESIKRYGVVEPLILQKREGYYEIIAGERRYRASKLAGLKEVPAIIKDYTEEEIVEIALIENIQREDLNPIEEALAYKTLIEEYGLKQDELAQRVSKSRAAITNTMRLLKLCNEVQQMIIDDMISSGHARALVVITDKELQKMAAQKIFDEGLSVRDTEKLVKNILEPKKVEPKKELKNKLIYEELEKRMKNSLGTKVNINRKTETKGKIEIEYYSQDDLERIIHLISK